MLFTCIKSWFFRNHSANFHQISHWSFCWNVIDSLFKWSCSIDCQAHIFFFKTKNCSNDDIFISCDDRIWKMLHNICMSAVAMSLRWANPGLWASCCFFFQKTGFDISCKLSPMETFFMKSQILFSEINANCLQWRQFARKAKSCFLGKNKKNINFSSVEFAQSVVKISTCMYMFLKF